MKKLFFTICSLVFVSIVLVISSCSKQEFEDDLATDVGKISQASSRDKDESVYEVEYILEYIKANAPIDWSKERNAKLLHSIGFYTDSSYIVGYKRKGFTDFENAFNSKEISKPGWKDARKKILNKFNFKDGDILQNEGENDDIFPAILVKFSSLKTMERLVEMDELYAIEPQIELFLLMFDEERQAAVRFEDPIVSRGLNELGCDCNLPNEPHVNAFHQIEPGMKMPWNYKFNGVHEYAIGDQIDPTITHAWDISTGQNIGVAVIDSGVSYEQENLDNFGAFDMVGLSFERHEERRDFLGVELGYRVVAVSTSGVPYFVTVESRTSDDRKAHDRCGHGTRQAGLVAGPRGDDGNSVGFAYNCDLYNYRAVHNPIILTNREKLGVYRALLAAGTESNIKIISMALAQPFVDITSVFIRSGVNFADSEGKMIVCAAGTGIPNTLPIYGVVLFPANMEKTIAVTGIRMPSSYPGPLTDDDHICSLCFAGDEVNFGVIMQDANDNDRTTLTVTCDGDEPEYSTGSSSATGSFSGMAALVWSELGSSASRDDVLQRMISASSNPHPEYQQGNISGAHPYLGNGWVNVKAALE